METETVSQRYSGLDAWEPSEILDALIEGQMAAVAAVRGARAAMEAAAAAVEARLRSGSGRLIYAGGSSRHSQLRRRASDEWCRDSSSSAASRTARTSI